MKKTRKPDEPVRLTKIYTRGGDAGQTSLGDGSRVSKLEPLKSFVLPGGTEAAARLHLARAVCRRAESVALWAADERPVNPAALVYLNRLSDLLFILARAANEGREEPLWKPGGAAS